MLNEIKLSVFIRRRIVNYRQGIIRTEILLKVYMFFYTVFLTYSNYSSRCAANKKQIFFLIRRSMRFSWTQVSLASFHNLIKSVRLTSCIINQKKFYFLSYALSLSLSLSPSLYLSRDRLYIYFYLLLYLCLPLSLNLFKYFFSCSFLIPFFAFIIFHVMCVYWK